MCRMPGASEFGLSQYTESSPRKTLQKKRDRQWPTLFI